MKIEFYLYCVKETIKNNSEKENGVGTSILTKDKTRSQYKDCLRKEQALFNT